MVFFSRLIYITKLARVVERLCAIGDGRFVDIRTVSLRAGKCLTQFRSQLKTHLLKVAFT